MTHEVVHFKPASLDDIPAFAADIIEKIEAKGSRLSELPVFLQTILKSMKVKAAAAEDSKDSN